MDLEETPSEMLAFETAPATKSKKPGGTFQSMGLSRPVIKAVERKGYKLATPIQRRCIPTIMTGRDVVAMARTGSGKSAAFLLPLIDKLKIRQPRAEIRALILSPTRELATQTFKFVKEFTKFTNLVSKLIIGGESIGRDFETITSAPDILVSTPGRLAHVLVEMKKKLDGVEIVVFDEADRLFEPGFKEMEQVNEICRRLNDTKQTLLFSATMPQRLAEFAKADLKDPVFVRLDVEANLSETLKSVHLHCNQQDKFAVLMHLLKNFVRKDQMTVVFMPTRHHIEYAKLLLTNSHLDCSYVYSSMDPEARKINIDKFTKKNCRIMLVTDIAARGIDIPLLDIVINFNFPFKPKLYIHRVGRVARAGKFGCAISIVSHDETPYLHALHMFLDKPLTKAAQLASSQDALDPSSSLESIPDMILGSVPQAVLDDENDILRRWHEHDEDLKSMVKVCDNAMKPYLKTREPPTSFSVKASKDIHRGLIGNHPLFKMTAFNGNTTAESQQDIEEAANELSFLDRIKAYKPKETIFEIGHIKGNKRTEAYGVMQKKRHLHDKIAADDGSKLQDEDDAVSGNSDTEVELKPVERRNIEPPISAKPKNDFEDSKFYLKYVPDDYVKEKGLAVDRNAFNSDLKRATLDLVADDEDQLKRQRHQMVWDRKKKKYIRADQLMDEKKVKKIKTESGAYISASYSSGLYEKWKSQSKVEHRLDDDDGFDSDSAENSNPKQRGQMSLEKLRSKLKPAKRRRELKNPDEMLKERGIKEKREAILRIKTMRKAERNAQRAGKSNPSTQKGPRKGGRKPDFKGSRDRRSSGAGGRADKRKPGHQKGGFKGGRKSESQSKSPRGRKGGHSFGGGGGGGGGKAGKRPAMKSRKSR